MRIENQPELYFLTMIRAPYSRTTRPLLMRLTVLMWAGRKKNAGLAVAVLTAKTVCVSDFGLEIDNS